jgi:hypothetical protein
MIIVMTFSKIMPIWGCKLFFTCCEQVSGQKACFQKGKSVGA